MAIDNDDSDIESIDDLFGDDDVIDAAIPKETAVPKDAATNDTGNSAFDDMFIDVPSSSTLSSKSDYGMTDSQQDDFIDSLFGDGGNEISSLVSDFSEPDSSSIDDSDLDSIFADDSNRSDAKSATDGNRNPGKEDDEAKQAQRRHRPSSPSTSPHRADARFGSEGDSDSSELGDEGSEESRYSAYDDSDSTNRHDDISDDANDTVTSENADTNDHDGDNANDSGKTDTDAYDDDDNGKDSVMRIDAQDVSDDDDSDDMDDAMARAYDDADDDIDVDSDAIGDDFDLSDLGDMELDGMIDGFMGESDGKRSGKRSKDFEDSVLGGDDELDDDIDSDDDDYYWNDSDTTESDDELTSPDDDMAYDGDDSQYDEVEDSPADIDDTPSKSGKRTKRGTIDDDHDDADVNKSGYTSDSTNDDAKPASGRKSGNWTEYAEEGGKRSGEKPYSSYNGEYDTGAYTGNDDITATGARAQPMTNESRMGSNDGRPTKNEMDERHRREREERRARKGLSTTETEDVDVPQWVVSMRAKIRSNVSHAFLLSGNIRDYMVRNISIQDGIVLTLDPQLSEFDIICVYDQAHGLNFYESDMVVGDSEPEDYRDAFIEAMHEAQDDLGWDRTADVPTNPVDLFTIISKICEQAPSEGKSGRILMFADFLELLVPDGNGSAMRPDERKLSIIMSDMCRSERADECGSVFVFFSDNLTAVSQVIRSTASRTDVIDVPAPVLAERRDFIDHVIDVEDRRLSDGRSLFDDDRDDDASGEGVTRRWFAINTAGLACYQIEDIALRSLSDDTPITKTLVKERKNDIIRTDYENVLEIMDPKSGFDAIGGLDNIKAYFKKNVINPIHRGDLSACPMGILLSGAPGVGKATINSTPIYRISQDKIELTTMGQLQVGDRIFGRNGQLTTVVNKYPQDNLDAYKVSLKDGRSIICSADHLWGVYSKTHGKMKMYIRSTNEMIEKGIFSPNSDGSHPNRSKYFVPMNGCLDFPEKNLPVDPYVLGAFIGNGDMTDATLSLSCDTVDEETVKRIADIIHATTYRKESTGYSWHFYHQYTGNRCDSIRITTMEIFGNLREVIGKKAGRKDIPESYLTASYNQRIALLQGLMDTDGCIHGTSGRDTKKRYNCEYATTSKKLAYSVSNLLFTLGMSNTVNVQDRTGQMHVVNGKEYERKSVEYTVRINIPNEDKPKLFRLSRKKAIAKEAAGIQKKRHYEYIGICGIEKLDKKLPMTCITVDADDGLFCIGDDCVVTHNTMLAKAVAYESGMNCVNLNLNQIMDKWVGSSERNLKRALDCAQAMAPTILFIDEIDEALPNRHNNNDASGVNKRMNQMLLTYFSDTTHRGQVVVLAATNYPDKLDPAIKRMGRFDDHIPMFAPDRFGRARILLIAAKKKGYTLSWFESPDKMINNPFAGLINWLEAGNRPHNQKFVGNQSSYYYNVRIPEGYGRYRNETHSAYLPEAIQKLIGKPKIPVHEFYRGMEILFEGQLTGRTMDAAQGIRESDEDYFARIDKTLADNAILFFEDPDNPTDREMKSFKFACRRMKLYDMRYGPFYDKTEFMTGAELDVVVSKCITLMRDMIAGEPDRVRRLLQAKEMKDEHDIPFEILREACETILPATVGIKSMEDAALLDATDMSFIPDAKYNTSDSGKDKSYRERLSELRAQMQNADG